MESDYSKYRGKCRQLSEDAVRADPTLTLVRGFYHDPIWGKQQHWWTTKLDGTIYDPTKLQFPSKGIGEYEPFDGMCECELCGKQVKEENAYFMGRHVYCTGQCYMKDVL